jgi:ATP-dependent Lon protease
VVIPEENSKDLADIPDNIVSKLDIHPVKWIDQVFEIAMHPLPLPLTKDNKDIKEIQSSAESANASQQVENVRAH